MSSSGITKSSSANSLDSSDLLTDLIDGPRDFIRESIHILNRCTKPDRREFLKVSQAVAVGFFIMGFIGFFIKLIHIPINNIIVGGAA